MTAPVPWNTYPYNENYFFSIERQLDRRHAVQPELCRLAGASSAGRFIPPILATRRLCLALSKPSAVAPGSPTCGPFGEDTTYITAAGKTIQGTRSGLGPDFANDDYDASIGNSNYNSFQASLRHSGKNLNFSLGYTFSKSIDQASSISDPLNPFNFGARARFRRSI